MSAPASPLLMSPEIQTPGELRTGPLRVKAALLVGGPSVGTRFRPLSLTTPKPLFPIAGLPMIYHHIAALAQVEGMKEILLIGFFGENGALEGLRELVVCRVPVSRGTCSQARYGQPNYPIHDPNF